MQVLLGQCRFPATGVFVVRVARVNNDVARFQQRLELLDHGVNRSTGLDHDQDTARLFQRVNQLLERLRPNEVALVSVLLKQGIGLFHRPVVKGYGVPAASEVAGQVRSHDGEACYADLCTHQVSICRFAPIVRGTSLSDAPVRLGPPTLLPASCPKPDGAATLR